MTDYDTPNLSRDNHDNKVVPYAVPIIKLLQGVLYPDDSGWETLGTYFLEVEYYFAQIGVRLEYVKGEYAFLRQPRPDRANEDDASADVLPRLIRSYPLSYLATLICVLLRERLIEHELQQNQGVPTISRAELYERMMPFMKEQGSESALQNKMKSPSAKQSNWDLSRKPKIGKHSRFRAIVKARIEAGLLADIRTRLVNNLNDTDRPSNDL